MCTLWVHDNDKQTKSSATKVHNSLELQDTKMKITLNNKFPPSIVKKNTARAKNSDVDRRRHISSKE